MTTHLHIGSSLEAFLDEESRLEEATEKAIKRVLAWQIALSLQRPVKRSP